jgi:hypothetical protein
LSEPKHLTLLKTLYGMTDEMLSKNFLEDKKTNQKNLFDREMLADNSKLNNDGRARNFEEMMEDLRAQLDEMDFIEEYQRAQEENDHMYGEEYYIEDPGDLRFAPMSPNPAIGDDFNSQRTSPEFNNHLK